MNDGIKIKVIFAKKKHLNKRIRLYKNLSPSNQFTS